MVDHSNRAPRESGFFTSEFMQTVMKVAFALGISFSAALPIVAVMGSIEFP